MQEKSKEEIRVMMEDIRMSLLGRNGSLPKIMRAIGYFNEEDSKKIAQVSLELKRVVSEGIDKARKD